MDQNETPPQRASRAEIIRTVQTPLGFFALVVLVVEAILGLTASLSSGPDRTYLVIGMLVVILLLIGIVAFMALYRPHALKGEAAPKKAGAVSSMQTVEHVIKPKVLCASTAQFEALGFDKDVDVLKRTFGKRLTVERNVTAGRLRELLITSNQRFDILHLLTYVNPQDGSLQLVPDDPDQKISANGFTDMIENCQAKVVVLAVCDSIVLAAHASRQVNMLAATSEMQSKSFVEWAECFYGLLQGGHQLSRAYDIARSTTGTSMVLLLKEDLSFAV